jgi:RNA-binding protein 25
MSEEHMREIFLSCGPIINWNRVVGGDGTPRSFGFCSFTYPESALRALRLLDGFDLGEKNISVKVDDKTRDYLDNYVKTRRVSDVAAYEAATKREDQRVSELLKIVIKKVGKEAGFSQGMAPSEEALSLMAAEPVVQTESSMSKRLIEDQIRMFRETVLTKEEREKQEREKQERAKQEERDREERRAREKRMEKEEIEEQVCV